MIVLDSQTAPYRHVAVVVGLVVLVGLAGCSGLGGEDVTPTATQTPDEPDYPDIYERVVESLDETNATTFSAAVTGGGDELSDRGETFLTLLAAVEEVGTAQRNAVVARVVETGRIESELLETLERLQNAPPSFQTVAYSYGLVDTDGDGLTEGEAVALGLNGSGDSDRVADFAQRLGADGYDETEIKYLERLAELDEFQWTQARQLGSLASTTDETVTEEALRAIEDDSGDGLLNAMARRLEFDPATNHENVTEAARTLGTDSFDAVGIRYLKRYAQLQESRFLRQQAAYFGLTDPTDGVTLPEVRALEDDSGDGLINAMKRELGLDSETTDERIAALARPLAAGGYDETALAYLKRVDSLRAYQGNDYEVWAQAGELSLLEEAVENGTVTDRQVWQLQNNDSDRLLNGIETEFGTDPETADTAGDGYLDHYKWGPMRDIGLDVHPGQPDIYVEMDVADGVRVPETEIELVETTFEEEPPADIGPIHVDFLVCNTEQQDVQTSQDMNELVPDVREMRGLGFHYMLMTDGLGQRNIEGLTLTSSSGESWMLVDGTIHQFRGDVYQAAVIGHELGHSLGLEPSAFLGIDSFELSHEEYASIMNYNHDTVVTFSTGPPFNDYQHIADEQYGSWHQNRSALERMWDQGEAPENVLCESTGSGSSDQLRVQSVLSPGPQQQRVPRYRLARPL